MQPDMRSSKCQAASRDSRHRVVRVLGTKLMGSANATKPRPSSPLRPGSPLRLDRSRSEPCASFASCASSANLRLGVIERPAACRGDRLAHLLASERFLDCRRTKVAQSRSEEEALAELEFSCGLGKIWGRSTHEALPALLEEELATRAWDSALARLDAAHGFMRQALATWAEARRLGPADLIVRERARLWERETRRRRSTVSFFALQDGERVLAAADTLLSASDFDVAEGGEAALDLLTRARGSLDWAGARVDWLRWGERLFELELKRLANFRRANGDGVGAARRAITFNAIGDARDEIARLLADGDGAAGAARARVERFATVLERPPLSDATPPPPAVGAMTPKHELRCVLAALDGEALKLANEALACEGLAWLVSLPETIPKAELEPPSPESLAEANSYRSRYGLALFCCVRLTFPGAFRSPCVPHTSRLFCSLVRLADLLQDEHSASALELAGTLALFGDVGRRLEDVETEAEAIAAAKLARALHSWVEMQAEGQIRREANSAMSASRDAAKVAETITSGSTVEEVLVAAALAEQHAHSALKARGQARLACQTMRVVRHGLMEYDNQANWQPKQLPRVLRSVAEGSSAAEKAEASASAARAAAWAKVEATAALARVRDALSRASNAAAKEAGAMEGGDALGFAAIAKAAADDATRGAEDIVRTSAALSHAPLSDVVAKEVTASKEAVEATTKAAEAAQRSAGIKTQAEKQIGQETSSAVNAAHKAAKEAEATTPALTAEDVLAAASATEQHARSATEARDRARLCFETMKAELHGHTDFTARPAVLPLSLRSVDEANTAAERAEASASATRTAARAKVEATAALARVRDASSRASSAAAKEREAIEGNDALGFAAKATEAVDDARRGADDVGRISAALSDAPLSDVVTKEVAASKEAVYAATKAAQGAQRSASIKAKAETQIVQDAASAASAAHEATKAAEAITPASTAEGVLSAASAMEQHARSATEACERARRAFETMTSELHGHTDFTARLGALPLSLRGVGEANSAAEHAEGSAHAARHAARAKVAAAAALEHALDASFRASIAAAKEAEATDGSEALRFAAAAKEAADEAMHGTEDIGHISAALANAPFSGVVRRESDASKDALSAATKAAEGAQRFASIKAKAENQIGQDTTSAAGAAREAAAAAESIMAASTAEEVLKAASVAEQHARSSSEARDRARLGCETMTTELHGHTEFTSAQLTILPRVFRSVQEASTAAEQAEASASAAGDAARAKVEATAALVSARDALSRASNAAANEAAAVEGGEALGFAAEAKVATDDARRAAEDIERISAALGDAPLSGVVRKEVIESKEIAQAATSAAEAAEKFSEIKIQAEQQIDQCAASAVSAASEADRVLDAITPTSTAEEALQAASVAEHQAQMASEARDRARLCYETMTAELHGHSDYTALSTTLPHALQSVDEAKKAADQALKSATTARNAARANAAKFEATTALVRVHHALSRASNAAAKEAEAMEGGDALAFAAAAEVAVEDAMRGAEDIERVSAALSDRKEMNESKEAVQAARKAAEGAQRSAGLKAKAEQQIGQDAAIAASAAREAAKTLEVITPAVTAEEAFKATSVAEEHVRSASEACGRARLACDALREELHGHTNFTTQSSVLRSADEASTAVKQAEASASVVRDAARAKVEATAALASARDALSRASSAAAKEREAMEGSDALRFAAEAKVAADDARGAVEVGRISAALADTPLCGVLSKEINEIGIVVRATAKAADDAQRFASIKANAEKQIGQDAASATSAACETAKAAEMITPASTAEAALTAAAAAEQHARASSEARERARLACETMKAELNLHGHTDYTALSTTLPPVLRFADEANAAVEQALATANAARKASVEIAKVETTSALARVHEASSRASHAAANEKETTEGCSAQKHADEATAAADDARHEAEAIRRISAALVGVTLGGVVDGTLTLSKEAVEEATKAADDAQISAGVKAQTEQTIKQLKEQITVKDAPSDEKRSLNGLVDILQRQPTIWQVIAHVVAGDGAQAGSTLAAKPADVRKSAEGLFANGATLGLKGEWAAAVGAYRSAVEANPALCDAWFSLGLAEHWKNGGKNCEAEIEPYSRCIALDPTHAHALCNLGVVLKNVNKNHADAERHYRASIAADPSHACARVHLGKLLKDVHKDHDGAEREYRAAIEANPNHANAHANLGLLLKNVREDYDGAEQSFRTAIAADPKHANAHDNLGVLLKTVRKDLEGAERSYNAAIDADPKHSNAHWNLSTLLEKRGDVDGAIREIREFVRKGDDAPGGEARLAKLLAKQQRRASV